MTMLPAGTTDVHVIGGVLKAGEEAAAVAAPSCLRALPQQLALLIGLWDDAALEVLDPRIARRWSLRLQQFLNA